MTKYTPGPWLYDIEADTVFANDGRYGERTAICKVDDQPEYEEHQANASLIAAAPELLEALEKTYHFLVESTAILNKCLHLIPEKDEANACLIKGRIDNNEICLSKAFAIIAKAKGATI